MLPVCCHSPEEDNPIAYRLSGTESIFKPTPKNMHMPMLHIHIALFIIMIGVEPLTKMLSPFFSKLTYRNSTIIY